MKNIEIKRPCVAEVERCLKIWNTEPEYENFRYQEKSVVMIFREQYPKNTKIEEVLVKVAVLNDFYAANIFKVYPVARHIVKLDIDNSLANADLDIVDKIARVDEKSKRHYSFATKYCSHHRPDDFPIYDKFVSKTLTYFKDKFYKSGEFDLKNYKSFKNVILEFRKFYKLEQYTLKQLDHYLWVLGREKFTKKSDNTNLENNNNQ